MNNSFVNETHNSFSYTCPAISIHLTFTVVAIVFGLLVNCQLLAFCVSQPKVGRTPDKILILNLAITDIVALSVCAPMHINDVLASSTISQQFIEICHWGFTLLLIFLFCNLSTLATIAVDRYDALTRFAHQRKFRSKTAIYASCVIWTLSGVVGGVTCREKATTVPFCSYVLRDNFAVVSKDLIARVVIITIVISICCSVTSQLFRRAARYIRKHRSKMDEMFGPREKQRKIDFTKTCVAFSFAYIITWAPFGVMATIYAFSPTKWAFCTYQWTHSISLVSFLIIPVVYMTSDKRVITFLRISLHCTVAPANENLRNITNVKSAEKTVSKADGSSKSIAPINCAETTEEGQRSVKRDTEVYITTEQEICSFSNAVANENETVIIQEKRNKELNIQEGMKDEGKKLEESKDNKKTNTNPAFENEMLETHHNKIVLVASATTEFASHQSCKSNVTRDNGGSEIELHLESNTVDNGAIIGTENTETKTPTQFGKESNEKKENVLHHHSNSVEDDKEIE